jgi:hypothetical protein
MLAIVVTTVMIAWAARIKHDDEAAIAKCEATLYTQLYGHLSK